MTIPAVAHDEPAWSWPIDLMRYDRSPTLSSTEAAALRVLGSDICLWRQRLRPGCPRSPDLSGAPSWPGLERLLTPLTEARAALELANLSQQQDADLVVAAVLHRCGIEGQSFWGWDAATWIRVLGVSDRSFRAEHPWWVGRSMRQSMIAISYLLRCFVDLGALGNYRRWVLACRVFGRERMLAALDTVQGVLAGWGYVPAGEGSALARVLSEALLTQGSPRLSDLSPAVLDALRVGAIPEQHTMLQRIQRALAALGLMDVPQTDRSTTMAIDGVDPQWEAWVRRWEATSTLTPATRRNVRGRLLRLGRWLHATHPGGGDPAAWTRELCAAAIAAIDRMRVGEYAQRHACLGQRLGQPLSAHAKGNYITSLRQFFRDCQEWSWIPVRFDPRRALAIPRSVTARTGPNPRVIADDIWAKLLWAGLHLDEADVPSLHDGGQFYPLAFLQALAVTWLFSGLRSDEIVRLRLGCVRWQRGDVTVPHSDGAVLPQDATCLLDVPVHKTGTAFTKPVDPVVGQAIAAWEAIRPAQPVLLDPTTGEAVAFLFCYRAKRLGTRYLNLRLIPLLCRKAGVPLTDARGPITSHRARSTIASQLYNAKEPMTLFELQEWLGHRSPSSTQYYARITPTTLAKAYTDAGYFARNLRTIEVLLDREAVNDGTAAAGAPWQYYDLGHGYCTYTFFEQCPHRMACARCAFYLPKESSKAQLLEAKRNLQRMLQAIPLTEDERAAVDDGVVAVDQVVQRLLDVPTPAGPTPRELSAQTVIPLRPVSASASEQETIP